MLSSNNYTPFLFLWKIRKKNENIACVVRRFVDQSSAARFWISSHRGDKGRNQQTYQSHLCKYLPVGNFVVKIEI